MYTLEFWRDEIEGLPQDYNRDERQYMVVREVMGKVYYADAFESFIDASNFARTIDGGQIAYLLEDDDIPEYDSDDWDDEPSDYCDDLGFDPYEGCYTFNC